MVEKLQIVVQVDVGGYKTPKENKYHEKLEGAVGKRIFEKKSVSVRSCGV